MVSFKVLTLVVVYCLKFDPRPFKLYYYLAAERRPHIDIFQFGMFKCIQLQHHTTDYRYAATIGFASKTGMWRSGYSSRRGLGSTNRRVGNSSLTVSTDDALG